MKICPPRFVSLLQLWVLGLVCLLLASLGNAQSSVIRIELDSRSNTLQRTDQAYREYQAKLAALSSGSRALRKLNTPLILPAIIRLTQNGIPLPTGGRTRSGEITLDIDPSFNSASRPNRVAFLQSVFDTAKPTIEAVFGAPAISGSIRVVNVDASEISSDRRIIVGGYYLPNNGSGQREIRLGDYNADETMAVSLIHTLLLAYLPDPAYGFDAYLEGICREATQRICRITSALPSTLQRPTIESVLENSYEIGPFYDWTNQRALSGTRFIAPNLLNLPIPDGTLGGIFLARYKMAGTAWQKLSAEYPNLIKDLNVRLASNPSLATTQTGLESMLSASLGAGATVEGLPLNQWLKNQFILQTRNVVGSKLQTQIFPVTSELTTTDFGVFGIEITAFSTLANGNETLASGTSYPVFWDETFNRISAGPSDQIDIAGSYGSIVPNFPNKGTNVPYRVAIDIPYLDRLTRNYVPAGAVATPSSSVVSDFYGTYVGPAIPASSTLVVRLTIGSETLPDIPIRNGAFGARIGTAAFLSTRSLVVRVVRKDTGGSETVLLTRRVNKGPNELALSLGDAPVQDVVYPVTLARGVQLLGLIGDPVGTDLSEALPTAGNLFARYNPARTNYDFYPLFGTPQSGFGLFSRLGSSFTPTYSARVENAVPTSVPLRPGWNQITVPGNFSVNVNSLQVTRAKDFPVNFADASTIIGNTIFQFNPGSNDPITGMPEAGTFTSATTLTPGRGYFVRCLAPEGATILFTPGSSSPKISPPPPRCEFKLTFTSQRDSKDQTEVWLGQSTRASSGFDPALDSSLPPGVGSEGLQMSVVGSHEPRYKEFRGFEPTSRFLVRVSGCKKGQSYQLKFQTTSGRASQILIRDLRTNQTVLSSMLIGGSTFVANASVMEFEVSIRGGRS